MERVRRDARHGWTRPTLFPFRVWGKPGEIRELPEAKKANGLGVIYREALQMMHWIALGRREEEKALSGEISATLPL